MYFAKEREYEEMARKVCVDRLQLLGLLWQN